MALNNDNNDKSCKCTTPEYELVLNEQGPQGRQGEKGDAGFTPIISVKDNTPSNYTLNILTQDGQITTPNLKANLPAGGATGQVLTKNSGEQDDCSWQNLPNATEEVEGIARLATETDFTATEDSSVSNNSIVTPELFNNQFELRFENNAKNLVTRDTKQTITGKKTIMADITVPYNSAAQRGRLVTNVIANDYLIPLIEPYDSYGSFRIGGATPDAPVGARSGFDINNELYGYGVTYYNAGRSGQIIADFNIEDYVKAGSNITIDKDGENHLTINSTGGGDFIPTEGDVNNIIGTKNLTAGGYIGLTQPLGCGISAGGTTIFTYSTTRVGTNNYFNPIIGSGQSQYTQINSPYLRGSDGTRFVTQTDYATTSTGGTVKVDGTTITINNGVISAAAAVNELGLRDVKDEIASTTDVANNVSEALNGFKFVETSEKQYKALGAHDANTLYIITS